MDSYRQPEILKPQEACGVFAIYAPQRDVARLTYFGLYALQHRGQESAGISSSNDGYITTVRDRGLLPQVFDEQKLQALPGQAALGHVRYSTAGDGSWENAQPLWRDDLHPLAFAHNGNLTNANSLRAELQERQIDLRGNSDSEIIAALISAEQADDATAAAKAILPRLRGAVSAALLTPDTVIAFRDPWGFRPLALGRLGDNWLVASESCAFDIIGAELFDEIAPGELVTINDRGLQRQQVVSVERRAHCLFENIYFSRPDSQINGRRVQPGRRELGRLLWESAPVEADLVVAVPDSGVPAARGLAAAAGIPQDDGLIKNRYVARTFIQPGQELRQHGLGIKFNPLPEIVAGQRLIVVDDSIVRGNTTRQIVAMLRQAGAREIHLRIASPPVRHPCHYGVDMSSRQEMIANRYDDFQQLAAELGADSLAYLTLGQVYQGLQLDSNEHCAACFSGIYPLKAG